MKEPNFNKTYRIIDATWDLPMSKRNFTEEHKNKRIPGAKYFSLAECRDKTSKLPMMLPKPEDFASYVHKLAGIEKHHHVIIYDNSERFGLFSAPRCWYIFRVMGHEFVHIVDGGLPKWVKDGFETASGEYSQAEELPAPTGKYEPKFRPELVQLFSFIKENSQKENPVQVVDARPGGRFKGIAPEPNPAIPSGHFAKAINLPFFQLFDREKNVMKQPGDILEAFKQKSIDLDKEVISSCGSGIAASVVVFGVYYAKGRDIPLFDGSWAEWATTVPELIIKET